ncbi:P-loop containing nucleoside triphosphate hydrolase protein [Irpex rosettiformis]|uniref:P-loop containing nucleoside triphosphate hydrolase protein n=1 Tax=Irpex rosettiformis TaxID=378272 RepID=A0ACB8TUT8_9APHY|nr:P-loop containing nucleoside triphosphate hydrolase protein [Irpex rosettiformis]
MLNSRKRKAADDDQDNQTQPRKLPAISENGNNKPLRPSKVLPNRAAAKGKAPALPAPKATAGPAIRRTTRATSAPAKNEPVRPPARPTVVGTRGAAGRTTTGPLRGKAAEDARFHALQEQMTSIESARAADAARIAAILEAEQRKLEGLQSDHQNLTQELADARAQELNQRRELVTVNDELEALKRKHANELMVLELEIKKKEREIRELKEDLRLCQEDLERERDSVKTLKSTVSQQSTAQLTLTTQVSALQAQLSALQSALDMSCNSSSQLKLELESERKRVADLESENRAAETLRRKLHNMVQELKGNIRVFCRVRPVLASDLPANALAKSIDSGNDESPNSSPERDDGLLERVKADITYPDKLDPKEIILRASSESATGQERKDEWTFTFDRVFDPRSTQAEVFEEISLLAQSCVDGYNVCIFAYGQTGSGKSFTMEGGSTEYNAGMIPRAVEEVFKVAKELECKGWEYKMEGQFLEIYNETINDLLGKGEFDKKRHDIHHDKAGRTTVSDVNVVPLRSPTQVRSLLSIAQSRRTVASTLMNERSSRSHSVFTLRISGENAATGETCEGSLNLVDLAGSERLEKSGAGNDKDRLKETQSINKSLSALGDVIAALGEKGDGKTDKHIPYRNSKLTYLLQNSLSGNSKTLMVLNLSPLAGHLNESLCSLRFATKVNNTTLGTAKKQIKAA